MHAREWPARGSVIEASVAPVGGVVALLAGLGKVRLHVVGIRVPLEVLQVARDACRVSQVVVVVDVTLSAGRSRMRTGQGESRFAVIELSRLPRSRVVADLASLGKSLLHVIGIVGALEILEMAGNTRCTRQVVIIVDVTLCARSSSVRSRQRET